MASQKIYLRAFEFSDLDLINQWHNDDWLNHLTLGRKYFVSKDYDKSWLMDKMNNNQNQVYCAICEKDTNKLIGYTSLINIDFFHKKANWGGIVIGEEEERKKGYSFDASIEILKHAFFDLGMNKVKSILFESNTASYFLTAKMVGFKVDGRLRREIFKNNQFHDVLEMSLLKDEFEERHFKNR